MVYASQPHEYTSDQPNHEHLHRDGVTDMTPYMHVVSTVLTIAMSERRTRMRVIHELFN